MDAAQDAFIISFKRLSELRREAEFRAWLRMIATNVCKQRLRVRRPTSDLHEEIADGEPFQAIEYAIDVDRALAGLSSDTRLTVLLFYFEGNSVREISLFLGVPETTVMSRLRNARLQLRQDLQSMFDEPTKRSPLPEDFADRIPIPYDEYEPYRKAATFEPLSAWRAEWLLSAYPAGSTIHSTDVLGHDWEAIPDKPIRVTVKTPGGTLEPVILRMSGRKDGIKVEAALLPLLASLGLIVPRLVAGPVVDPDLPGRGMLMATTPSVGQSALAWAVEGGTKAIDHACEVVMEAIDQIKRVTAKVEASAPASMLERCTLADELTRVIEIGGPWMSDSRFAETVRRLEPIVAKIDLPLVFSDSGIGPNYRVDEHGNLIGFDSFCWARFEDPHYQISKYWTYDCWPIRRAGFVERYLLRQKLSMQDFAPRLGVRALVTLQREIAVQGGDGNYRNDMLGWLKLAMDNL